MSAGLIKHLKQKTEADSNTAILMSQWNFDEKLVGKSLENTVSYYPHFSSHNASHSQQILVNIERLLGNNIAKLTATDTWLILEAAYWHDIGMLFNADEVQQVIADESFKGYVEELASNNVQDLHEFAKVWHEQGWQTALVYYDNPYKGVEKYRQMVAEWYRRDHPQNSSRVILEPFEKLGINAPRTELLPKRIYRYLAQICLAHGTSFTKVMQELPFRQTGMGTENCHPRFVACLLRLGDLFDIDDNRFCPIMAKQVGDMPAFSQTHKHKHQAIREFQLDNETVSVTAICETEMAYIECRRWFDWIEEEIQNQMSQWKNIVPHRDFGLLPTIDKLDVEMTNSKILLNDKPMKFSLDERSAIELLQGNNLYKDDMSIYRELIQNAIDATMIRVWLEHGQEHSTKKMPENANPYDEATRELFADYPIILDCKKIAEDENSTLWEFSIEDNGVGISRNDLEYMQKIAGSKNNKQKQKIMREMPVWMRPSGEFGIGLHSAFLLMKDLPAEQQKITIFTKSRLTHESLKIELNSPLSGKAGYCFIKKIEDLGKYGTKLIVKESFNRESSIYLPKIANGQTEKLNNYIKIGHSTLVLSKIYKIYSIGINPVIKIIDLFWNENSNRKNNLKSFFWDKENNASISIKLHEGGYNNNAGQINIFFKGQYVDYLYTHHENLLVNRFLNLDNLEVIVDFYGLRALDYLNVSRDKLTDNPKIIKLLDVVYSNLLKAYESGDFKEKFNFIFDGNKVKESFFVRFNNLESSDDIDNKWLGFRVEEDKTFEDIFNSEVFVNNIAFDIFEKFFNKNNIKNAIIMHSPVIDYLEKTNALYEIATKKGFRLFEVDININEDNFLDRAIVYSKKDINFTKKDSLTL